MASGLFVGRGKAWKPARAPDPDSPIGACESMTNPARQTKTATQSAAVVIDRSVGGCQAQLLSSPPSSQPASSPMSS